jgi:hypothetical protein
LRRSLDSDDKPGFLESLANRGQPESFRICTFRELGLREELARNRIVERCGDRDIAIGGIDTPAREDKLPWHENVVGVPPPQQHFRLSGGTVDNDESRSILRLDAGAKDASLLIDQMTGNRCHDDQPRGRERIM